MSEIEWEKVEEKPEKEFKVPGHFLLKQRQYLNTQAGEIANNLDAIAKLKEELESVKEESKSRGDKIKVMVEKVGELNEKLEETIKKIEEMNKKIDELNKDNEELTGKIKMLEGNNENLENLIKEKDEKIQTLSEQIEQKEISFSELEEKLKALPPEDEIKELKEKIESYPSPEEIEELKKRPKPNEVDDLLFTKDEEIESLNKELDSLKSQIEELKVKAETPAPAPTPAAVTTPEAKPVVAEAPMVDLESPKFSIKDDSKYVEKKAPVFSYAGDDISDKGALKKRVLPQEVLDIFNNIAMAIQGGIRAGELYRLLEDSRDSIANIFGFSMTLKRMGDVAKKLKKAPSNAQIDEESQNIFLQKIEEWKKQLEGG